jgi:hypothetical protein
VQRLAGTLRERAVNLDRWIRQRRAPCTH